MFPSSCFEIIVSVLLPPKTYLLTQFPLSSDAFASYVNETMLVFIYELFSLLSRNSCNLPVSVLVNRVIYSS